MQIVTDVDFLEANTLVRQKNTTSKGKYFKKIADSFGVDDRAIGKVEWCSDESAGGGVKRFGVLAGKYVLKDVYKIWYLYEI